MEIYEFGRSVMLAQLGFPVANKTFVCVLQSEEDISFNDAVKQMIENLKSKGVIIANVNNEIVTSTDGTTYTLAHEIIVNGGAILKRHSNILRHAFTRNTYIESLYIDENNQICDLTNRGMQYIINRDMASPLKQEEIHARGVDFLLNFLELHIKFNIQYGGQYFDYLDKLDYRNLPPVDKTNSIINDLATNYSEQFIQLVQSFGRLRNYFYNVCGLGYTIDCNLERLKPRKEFDFKESGVKLVSHVDKRRNLSTVSQLLEAAEAAFSKPKGTRKSIDYLVNSQDSVYGAKSHSYLPYSAKISSDFSKSLRKDNEL